jgi:hypothetical protein
VRLAATGGITLPTEITPNGRVGTVLSGRRTGLRWDAGITIGNMNLPGTPSEKEPRATGGAHATNPRCGQLHQWMRSRSRHAEAGRGDATVNNSERGNLVFDPFAGSGTTLIAAETVGRACLAMELDPAYSDVIVKRGGVHGNYGSATTWPVIHLPLGTRRF